MRFLARMWFLLALVIILAAGVGWGHSAPRARTDVFLDFVQPNITTAIILFLMAFSLDSGQRAQALRRPVASVWGCVVNLAAVPLLAWPLAIAQLIPDFRWGLIVTAATPCTLATASVFTRRAGGNDAVSLMTTLATNLGCLLVTPLWLALFFGTASGFEPGPLMELLGLSVVLPTITGQLAQLPPWIAPFAARHRKTISMAAQMIVLLLVAVAATDAGRTLAEHERWPSPLALGVIIASCLGLHGVAVAVGWYGSRALGLSRPDTIAVAIAGSQKTLPVGLMIVTSPDLVGADAPFITFPLVLYHATQLIVDSMLADYWRAGERVAIPSPTAAVNYGAGGAGSQLP